MHIEWQPRQINILEGIRALFFNLEQALSPDHAWQEAILAKRLRVDRAIEELRGELTP